MEEIGAFPCGGEGGDGAAADAADGPLGGIGGEIGFGACGGDEFVGEEACAGAVGGIVFEAADAAWFGVFEVWRDGAWADEDGGGGREFACGDEVIEDDGGA